MGFLATQSIIWVFFIYLKYIFFFKGDILSDINEADENYKKDLNIINGYMTYKKVSRDMKIKVRNYMEYLHNE